MQRRLAVGLGLLALLLGVSAALWMSRATQDPSTPDEGARATPTASSSDPATDAPHEERTPVRGRAARSDDSAREVDGDTVDGDTRPRTAEDRASVAEAGTVHGRVVDVDGRAIGGAEVWLAPLHVIFWYRPGEDSTSNYQGISYRAARQTADAEGRFTFRDVAMGGAYKIAGLAAGFGEAKIKPVAVPDEVPVQAPDLVLPRSCSLVVTVVDPDGHTVDACDIAIESYLFGPRESKPGPGVRRFENLQPDNWKLVVSRSPFLCKLQAIEIAPGEQAALTVRLERGGETLTGSVIGADGKPLPGVSVRAREMDRSLHSGPRGLGVDEAATKLSEGRVRTDAEGRFRIDGLRSGTHTVTATATGGATAELSEVEVPSKDVRIAFPRHAELSGRLHLPPGVSVPESFELRLHRLRAFIHPTALGTWTVPWSADGTFSLRAIPEGTGRTVVEIRVAGCAPFWTEFRSPGAEPYDIGDARPGIGYVVEGRVVDEAGSPIPGATVRDNRQTVRTDATGAFRLTDLALVNMKLYVDAPDFSERRVGASVGDEKPVIVRLEREAVLRGRVLDARDRALPEASVGIFAYGHRGRMSWHGECHADHRGVFGIRLPPGRYRIGTYSDLRADRDPTGPEVTLRPGERTWLILRR